MTARLAFLIWLSSAAAAFAQPALDGHNTGSATSGTTTTFTATTVANPEILVATAAVRATGSTNPNLTISGCSLTWSVLGTPAQFNNNSAKGTAVYSWTAKAASNLSGCTVTVTSDQTIQNSSAAYCSFSGINNTNAFDPHSGLPVTNTNGTATLVTAQVSMSTTLAHDTMVTGFGQNSTNMGGTGATTGATICASITNSGGLNFSNAYIVYKSFTTPQTNVSIGLVSNVGYFSIVGTALTADVGASGHSRIIQ